MSIFACPYIETTLTHVNRLLYGQLRKPYTLFLEHFETVMCPFLPLCNRLPSLLTEWSDSLETCIICNGYHPLMVPVLPLADHNGPFSRLSESPSVSLIVTEWGRRVTWEETRGTRGPSFTCQEAGIRSTWHGVHIENGNKWQLQRCEECLPSDLGTLRRLHWCKEWGRVVFFSLRVTAQTGLVCWC